jgi:DnaA family protein
MRQIPLAIGPEPDIGFDSFVPGANGAALAHLRTLGPAAAPVYLWGPAGSGKTRLLRALAQRVRDHGQQVGWFDAATPLPWTPQAGWGLVVVDRCDALDAHAQHAVFALFEEAASHGVQFAAAGRSPPVDLPLRDDLRTRLAWGHVFALQPLGEAETRAALRREADRRGIFLSDEVMDYLLQRFPRDLPHLLGLLWRLDRFSLERSRQVTVPLLRQMLEVDGVPGVPAGADSALSP